MSLFFIRKLLMGCIDISPRLAIFISRMHKEDRFIGRREVGTLTIYGFYLFDVTVNNMDSKRARIERVTKRLKGKT